MLSTSSDRSAARRDLSASVPRVITRSGAHVILSQSYQAGDPRGRLYPAITGSTLPRIRGVEISLTAST